jgi:hypothetical protein
LCAAAVTAAGRLAPDISVEELAHRRHAEQAVDRLGRDSAIAVILAVDRDDEVLPRAVVADPLKHRAASDVAALERAEIDEAAFAGLDRLGDDRGGRELCKQNCQGPDHDDFKLHMKALTS